MKSNIYGTDSLIDKLGELGADVPTMLEKALVGGALLIQNNAKVRAPFRTGTLKRSIHIGGHQDLAPDYQERDAEADEDKPRTIPAPEISGDNVKVFIGTNLSYAYWVEYGTSRMPARPFLRPAYDENQNAVQREIAEILAILIRNISSE